MVGRLHPENKKAPDKTGAWYINYIAIALRAPIGVCMPPPCIIDQFLCHAVQI